jgi:hypothetical protein
MVKGRPSVFTGMFSLLSQSSTQSNRSTSLVLPPIPPASARLPFSYLIGLFKPKFEDLSLECPDRPKMVVTACEHTERKHYAKNMCNNCYHMFGRGRTAWACLHLDRKLYAKGRCHECYLEYYHSMQKRRRH